jgi:hypothetical protein
MSKLQTPPSSLQNKLFSTWLLGLKKSPEQVDHHFCVSDVGDVFVGSVGRAAPLPGVSPTEVLVPLSHHEDHARGEANQNKEEGQEDCLGIIKNLIRSIYNNVCKLKLT